MVRQWQETERAYEVSTRPAEEDGALFDEACRLQRAIYAFPARTLADLCAKLPAFRYEAKALGNPTDAEDEAPPLEQSAMRGFIDDLERLSAGAGDRVVPPSLDAELLALAPDLDAVSADIVALNDRDQFAQPGTPDGEAMSALGTAVRDRAGAVAERIFTHQPATLAGLALTARAVALTTGEMWNAPDDDIEHTGRLLRILADKLFTLAGVDWRGRLLNGASSPAAALQPDPVYAAIENHLAHLDRSNNPPAGETDEEADVRYDAWSDAFDAMGAVPPATSEGLKALARHLRWYLTHTEHDVDGPPKWVLDLLFGVVERFGTPAAAAATKPSADPIFAAITENRLAQRLYGLACTAPNAGTKEGEARVDATGTAAYRAWRALLAMKPTTVAGAQALARYAADHIEDHGCWSNENEEEDARALFRAIAAAGPWHDRTPTAGTHPTTGGVVPGEEAWKPDPVIAEAAELARLDAAIGGLRKGDDRDHDEIPGYLQLEEQRDAVIEGLAEHPARSYEGLVAKGKAVRSFDRRVGADYASITSIAVSLAEDIERLGTLTELGLARHASARPAEAPLPMAAE